MMLTLSGAAPSDKASALAQAVDEDVDETQGGRLPIGFALGVKDADQRSEEVFGRDVGTDRPGRNGAIQQQPRSRRQLCEGIGFQLARPMRDKLKSLDQAFLGCGQANVGVKPAPQRADRVGLERELSGKLAEMIDLMTVDGLEQRLARWEMPVQRADADASMSSDRLKACLRASGTEDRGRGIEQALPVADRIRPRSPARHRNLRSHVVQPRAKPS